MSKVKFGVNLPMMGPSSLPTPRPLLIALNYRIQEFNHQSVKETAITAEKLGYDSIWVFDHFSSILWNEIMECWTTLTWVASLTKTIRIGTMVLCPLYRHPSLLAKMASTLDVISNGRLELGIGACAPFNELMETKPRGLTWAGPKTRIQMLEETIQVCKVLWKDEKANYSGKYYQLTDAICEPKPVQKPHPPLIIAGTGEKLALRIVAKYADKCNLDLPYDVFERKSNVLKRHCKAIGRDYDSIEKTLEVGVVIHPSNEEYLDDMRQRFSADGGIGSFDDWLSRAEEYYIAGTPDECVEQLQSYVDLGVDHFMIRFGDLPNQNGMHLFAKKVIPKIKP